MFNLHKLLLGEDKDNELEDFLEPDGFVVALRLKKRLNNSRESALAASSTGVLHALTEYFLMWTHHPLMMLVIQHPSIRDTTTGMESMSKQHVIAPVALFTYCIKLVLVASGDCRV